MNMGTTSMQKVSTTVSVSGDFLKKCMNDPDEKIAKENAERKAKEKKTEEEKQAKKRKEKRAEVEKTTEKRAEKSKARKEQIEKLAKGREIHNFNVSAIGTDVKSVTQNLIDVSLNKSVSARISFDIKA